MLNNLSYLSLLLSKSFSYSLEEKNMIFLHAESNWWELIKILKILEDEQIGNNYIKYNYKKHINIIWRQFNNEIIKSKENKSMKNIFKYKKKIKNIRFIESQDKNISIKNLNNLIETL